MYDSPISIIMSDMKYKIDEQIEQAIVTVSQKAGIDIDKEKLLKILTNDKQRYEDAYERGYKARDNAIVRCKDCMYAPGNNPHNYICKIQEHLGGVIKNPDYFFCADGKRDDEECMNF